MDLVFAMAARNPDSPRVAAHFAILNKAADDIGLNVDFDILAAVGTRHNESVVHTSASLSKEREDTGARSQHASSNGHAESDSCATHRDFLRHGQRLYLLCHVLDQLSRLAVALLEAGQSLVDTLAFAFCAAASANKECVCRREHDGSVLKNCGPGNHATSSFLSSICARLASPSYVARATHEV